MHNVFPNDFRGCSEIKYIVQSFSFHKSFLKWFISPKVTKENNEVKSSSGRPSFFVRFLKLNLNNKMYLNASCPENWTGIPLKYFYLHGFLCIVSCFWFALRYRSLSCLIQNPRRITTKLLSEMMVQMMLALCFVTFEVELLKLFS